MKKKILLLLMSVFAITSALNAQDQEQTAAPSVVEGYGEYFHSFSDHDYDNNIVGAVFFMDIYNYVTFENNDECEATIYYRNEYDSEWKEFKSGMYDDWYYGGLMGFTGTVEAYALAEGKLPSEIVTVFVYYYENYCYSTRLVDGIHYYYDDYYQHEYNWNTPSFEASVCSRDESQLYSPPYTGNIVIPSEIDILGYTYAVTGIRNAAFASTFDQSCDITSVELPNTIQEVNPSAFAGCTRLTSMILHAVEPPYSGSLFEYEYGDENYHYYDYIGFDGNQLYDQVKLFVPNEALDAYCAHEEWGKFTHIVPFIGAGPGDINGDGKLSISDVTNIIDQLLSGDVPAYADVNGDGKVSITDVTALIDMLLKG